MEKVLRQTQVLAQAILESEAYTSMKKLEAALTKDIAAADLVMAVSQKRQVVESILSSSDLDHTALAAAADDLEHAEEALSENELIASLRRARADFTQMMKNVNQILRFVMTGETGESEEEEGGCGGSCGSCKGGCHSH